MSQLERLRRSQTARWGVAAGLVSSLALAVACTAPAAPTAGQTPAGGTAPAGTAAAGKTAAAGAPAVGKLTIGTSALTTVTTAGFYNTGAGGGSGQSAQLYWPAYDGLTWIDRQGQLQKGLATEWTTTDAKTWTFKLRDDITFQDGSKFTSDDVLKTFTYYATPENKQQAVALFGNVDKMTAPNPTTIVFELKTPAAAFPKTIALGLVVKGNELQQKGPEEYFKQGGIGTGAYRAIRFVRGQEIAFEAMPPEYKSPRGPAAVKELILKDIPEASSRLAATRAGDTDVAYTILIDQLKEAQGAGLETKTYLGTANNHIVLDTVNGPTRDIKVRQALNMAIDRQTIINSVYQGVGQIDNQLIGSAVLGFNTTQRGLGFDQARARQLLAEAGFPNGFNMPFVYTTATPAAGADAAGAIAADLLKVGVRAEQKLITSNEWLNQYFGPPESRANTLFSSTTNWDQTFEAESVWRWWSNEILVGSPTQQGGRRWENPTFFDLYLKAKSTLNEADRARAYQAAGLYMFEQAPVLYLWVPGTGVAYNNKKVTWDPGLYADLWTPSKLQWKGGN